MRKLLPSVVGALVLIASGAYAQQKPGELNGRPATDPVRPQIGAGPHLDRRPLESGKDGESGAQPPLKPAPADANAGPSRPSTAGEQEDERKATQAKEKMKKKPGYQEDVPSPRASHTGLTIN